MDVDVARIRDQVFFEGPERGRRLSRFWTLLLIAAVIASAGVVSNSTATARFLSGGSEAARGRNEPVRIDGSSTMAEPARPSVAAPTGPADGQRSINAAIVSRVAGGMRSSVVIAAQ